jgi:hypothetical protein
MNFQHHVNLSSNKGKIGFIFPLWELVLWMVFMRGQRNHFLRSLWIFVKGYHVLTCATYAPKRLAMQLCSTSAPTSPFLCLLLPHVRQSPHRVVSSLACTLRAPLQTRFTAGGARGRRRVGREYTHTQPDALTSCWRSGEEGVVGATAQRQKEREGTTEIARKKDY